MAILYGFYFGACIFIEENTVWIVKEIKQRVAIGIRHIQYQRHRIWLCTSPYNIALIFGATCQQNST